METKYSVGIPVRNEDNTLEDCINSVLEQTVKPKSVFVCVNASTPEFTELAYSMEDKYDSVQVMESAPGKPSAWNEIVKSRDTDLMMMIDGDVLISSNSAESMMKEMQENPEIYVVGGNVSYLPSDSRIFRSMNSGSKETGNTQHFLSGRLYMMKTGETLALGDRLGISLMPTDIINEDALVRHVVSSEDRMMISSDAYSLANPIDNFLDWYKTTLRIAEGKKQIKEKYPQLASLDTFQEVSSKKSLIQKFIDTPGFDQKFLKVGFWALNRLIRKYVDFKHCSYNNIWAVPEATKREFDNQTQST
jgi:glycosyltransferase involved in cell wall biosynthesis